MTEPTAIDITSPSFKREPYEIYSRLRSQSPATLIRLPNGQTAWLFVRYDDVVSLLRDPRLVKDRRNAPTVPGAIAGPKVPAFLKPLTQSMLDRDDPDHARLRRLIQATFTPRRVELLADRTEAVASKLLDRIVRLRQVDLIADFAMPMPVTVICELLGVPERDQLRFAKWSATLIKMTSSKLRIFTSLPDMIALVRYLRHLVEVKRADPADDLTSALVQASDSKNELTGDELLSMLAILLSAGHETTTNLIGNGMFTLMRHADEADRLRGEPNLMESAVEEMLRYESPVATSTNRFAREAMMIGGVQVDAGDLVIGALTSANRDESRFEFADRFDIARSPNKHLTFGQGGHYCIGAPLARLEAKIAIGALLRRVPHMRLATPPSTVGADSKLSHRADPNSSQGWTPSAGRSSVDKYRFAAAC